jgi:hypothetical protein
MGDITKNFSYYEFGPKGSPKAWIPTSQYQKILLDSLANNLQVIRSEIPEGSYMRITSGVRTLSDYNRLKNQGYRPSKTSDHNCGVSIPLASHTNKFKIFGETYNFAVGAADIQPIGISTKELFNLSVRLTQGGKCDFGQIIYEYDPSSKQEWIHYGGSLKELFSEIIIDMINRDKFLKSVDGGRTYQIATSV